MGEKALTPPALRAMVKVLTVTRWHGLGIYQKINKRCSQSSSKVQKTDFGVKVIGSKVNDGAILLENHNLYESGLVCIYKHVLCSLLFPVSRRTGEKMLMNSLFRQSRKLFSLQSVTLGFPLFFLTFLQLVFLKFEEGGGGEKGQGEVFPSERRGAIKHK